MLRAVKLLVYCLFLKSLGLQGEPLHLDWVLRSPSLADPCLAAFPAHILGQTLSVHSLLVGSEALVAQAQDSTARGTQLFLYMSRTCGIAQHVSCTDLAKFNLQIHSLVLLLFGASFALGSGCFRLSQIILLLVLAWKQRGSLCPLSSIAALPGLSDSNSCGFIHFCRMEVG